MRSYFSQDMFETIFDHFPAGTSFNIMTHFYQLALSGNSVILVFFIKRSSPYSEFNFCFLFTGGLTHYNYGPTINKVLYQAPTPPECDLSKVTSPQAIFYSAKDVLATERVIDIINLTTSAVINHLFFIF